MDVLDNRTLAEVLEAVKSLVEGQKAIRLTLDSMRLSLDTLRMMVETDRQSAVKTATVEKVRCVRCGIEIWPRNMKRHNEKCKLKTFHISQPSVSINGATTPSETITTVDNPQPSTSYYIAPTISVRETNVDDCVVSPRRKRGRPPNK